MRGDVSRPIAPARFSRLGKSAANIEEDDAPLRIGQRVTHGKFGEGMVVGCEGQGDRAVVVINFAGAGEKRLMLGYAKLETID